MSCPALFLPSHCVPTLAVAAEATSRAARRRGLSRAISGMRTKAQGEEEQPAFHLRETTPCCCPLRLEGSCWGLRPGTRPTSKQVTCRSPLLQQGLIGGGDDGFELLSPGHVLPHLQEGKG